MNIPQEIEQSNERKEQLEDIKIKLGRIWLNIPLFIKCYFIITIILYLLSLPIKVIPFYLINNPSYTILIMEINNICIYYYKYIPNYISFFCLGKICFFIRNFIRNNKIFTYIFYKFNLHSTY